MRFRFFIRLFIYLHFPHRIELGGTGGLFLLGGCRAFGYMNFSAHPHNLSHLGIDSRASQIARLPAFLPIKIDHKSDITRFFFSEAQIDTVHNCCSCIAENRAVIKIIKCLESLERECEVG